MLSVDFHQLLQQRFKDAKFILQNDEVTLEVSPISLFDTCMILRDAPEFQFAQLIDLCGVDYLTYGISEWTTEVATSQGFSRGVKRNKSLAPDTIKMPSRFAVVYHLLSVQHNLRLRLRVFLPGDIPRVPSIITIWKSADWYEREAFDLYGILFEGHPDLRRILTDYGFIGYPFRKDFPLIGHVEMRYDAGEGRVVYEPVSIQPRTLIPKVVRYTASEESAKIEGTNE